MHAMVYHIPIFSNKYKSLKIYTGQGVECNNDVARGIVQRKSNNWRFNIRCLKIGIQKLHHHEKNEESAQQVKRCLLGKTKKQKRKKKQAMTSDN